jgi:transposase
MSKVHVIAMDTHCQTTDLCVKTQANGPGRWHRVKTTIPEIAAVIEQVRGSRELVLEEGPLAGWLLRNLKGRVDQAQSCDPRRNALIAKDGDKDDPIDAGKLADLYLGGFTRAVHHPESLARVVLKEAVGLYHERVAHRVAQANKVMGLLKRWGLMAKEKDFQAPEDRERLLAGLGVAEAGGGGTSPEGKLAAGHLTLLWRGYDEAVREEAALHRELVRLAKQEEVVVRWEKIPGIGWIRGITLLAYLDTPWRFKSKRHLWKYLGIGLTRAHSGAGFMRVYVDNTGNRMLKAVIVGAAETVIMHKSGELYRRYEWWRAEGQTYKNARRNVARDIAAACWAMWKTGAAFDERLLGGKPVPGETEGGGL